MIKTTKAQRHAILRYWLRDGSHRGMTYKEFRRTVQPTFGCDGAVVLQWCGMWVCIEKDGYGHT